VICVAVEEEKREGVIRGQWGAAGVGDSSAD
jgi:hypothetical protein